MPPMLSIDIGVRNLACVVVQGHEVLEAVLPPPLPTGCVAATTALQASLQALVSSHGVAEAVVEAQPSLRGNMRALQYAAVGVLLQLGCSVSVMAPQRRLSSTARMLSTAWRGLTYRQQKALSVEGCRRLESQLHWTLPWQRMEPTPRKLDDVADAYLQALVQQQLLPSLLEGQP